MTTLADVLRATADAYERRQKADDFRSCFFANAYVKLAKRIGVDKLDYDEHQTFLHAVHAAAGGQATGVLK